MFENLLHLSRLDLYNEIWEVSVKKISEKYDINYSKLLQLCHSNNIPIPQSGYWTKLEFDKPVEKTPLTNPEITNIDFNIAKKVTTKNTSDTLNKKISKRPAKKREIFQYEHVTLDSLGKADVVKEFNNEINIYDRNILYDEVWKVPMSTLCQKYAVSDVALKKVCKSLDIPTPPLGYWAKIYSGKPVEKTPLSNPNKAKTKRGARGDGSSNTRSYRNAKEEKYTLDFLSSEEKDRLFEIAQSIEIPSINSKAKPQIISYKPIIKKWKKQDTRDKYAQRSPSRTSYWDRNKIPFLGEYISEISFPRIFQILGALIESTEKFGGHVTNKLEFFIRDEHIPLEITESQSKIDHVLTKKELKALRDFEESKRRGYIGYEPKNMRKYDYIFNGNLTIYIYGTRSFKDKDDIKIEDNLGKIFISMCEVSQNIRVARIAHEEELLKKEEEERKRKELRQRYNDEVDRLDNLLSLVDDFEVATKIRNYTASLKLKSDLTEEEKNFILWAEKKANWLDPCIRDIDDLFGQRIHSKSTTEKLIDKKYGYW